MDQNTLRALSATRADAKEQPGFTIWDLLDATRNHASLILAVTIITLALGAVYALNSSPRYVASSQLIIESGRAIPGQAVPQDPTIDTTIADSQVEVLKSEAVHLAAIGKLNLLEDPEFVGNRKGLIRRLLEGVGILRPQDVDNVGPALRYMRENLSVRRVGRTYVLEVSFQSRNKETATKVANAVAQAYISNQVRDNDAAVSEASDYLEKRLAELRNDAVRADNEVQDYIVKHNAIPSASGQLTDQQLTDLQAERLRAGATLRMLESSAKSYRRLYDTFLERLVALKQQQSFPRAAARVLTTAREGEKSGPSGKLIMAGALLAGLAGGLGLAVARQRLDSSIRTAAKLEELIGAECLGVVPEISRRDAARHRRLSAEIAGRKAAQADFERKRSAEAEPAPQRLDAGAISTLGIELAAILDQLTHGEPSPQTRSTATALVVEHPKRKLPDLALEQHAVHMPFSAFAEALRRIKVASDVIARGRPVIIGFVSNVAGEGASFTAVNFAQLLAADGSETLLIDADLRRSSLSKRIAPEADLGLVQLLETGGHLADLVWTDQITGLAFLPTGIETGLANSATILTSSRVEAVLSAAKTEIPLHRDRPASARRCRGCQCCRRVNRSVSARNRLGQDPATPRGKWPSRSEGDPDASHRRHSEQSRCAACRRERPSRTVALPTSGSADPLLGQRPEESPAGGQKWLTPRLGGPLAPSFWGSGVSVFRALAWPNIVSRLAT